MSHVWTAHWQELSDSPVLSQFWTETHPLPTSALDTPTTRPAETLPLTTPAELRRTNPSSASPEMASLRQIESNRRNALKSNGRFNLAELYGRPDQRAGGNRRDAGHLD